MVTDEGEGKALKVKHKGTGLTYNLAQTSSCSSEAHTQLPSFCLFLSHLPSPKLDGATQLQP